MPVLPLEYGAIHKNLTVFYHFLPVFWDLQGSYSAVDWKSLHFTGQTHTYTYLIVVLTEGYLAHQGKRLGFTGQCWAISSWAWALLGFTEQQKQLGLGPIAWQQEPIPGQYRTIWKNTLYFTGQWEETDRFHTHIGTYVGVDAGNALSFQYRGRILNRV